MYGNIVKNMIPDSPFVKQSGRARLSMVEPDIEKLLGLVSLYTGEEIISEIIKPPFDSTVLDKKLMGLPISKEEALKISKCIR